MSSMSESTEINPQNSINSDLEGNNVRIESNSGDEGTGVECIGNGVPNRPDAGLTNESESKTIECEPEVVSNGTTGMTDNSGVAAFNGMRTTGANSTHSQTPDVCSVSRHSDTGDGVDDTSEEPSQDSRNPSVTEVLESGNEVIIIETVVKSDSNEVTLITDTTLKTTIHSFDQSFSDSSSESVHNSNTDNYTTNHNNKTSEMTTTTTSRPKQLKSLLKRGVKDKTTMKTTNGKNGRRRVTFSETMQVFCDDWPQNLMPQIIALKSPTDFNLVEVQGYMFEPPVEYQDFLPFEPPPDYRDFIANSLCALENDLNIHYIDDEDDDNALINRTIEQKLFNEISSKWESMILNNNECLEEEQIIGVLKEDAILQAIGSHISLPDEQLCPEDFPIHFQTKANETSVKLAESELSDITSDDGNDSTGSLQDIQSDSSITSQDTIILINTDFNDNGDGIDNYEILSHKKCFNDMHTTNEEMISDANSESVVVKSRTQTDEKSTKSDSIDNELSCETSNTSIYRETHETNSSATRVVSEGEEVDSTTDVTQEMQCNESEECDDKRALDYELNGGDNRKEFKLFTDDGNDSRDNHSKAFKRNLMFYENMFSDNSSNSRANSGREDDNRPTKHSVSQFVIENPVKYPIITQTISNNINTNHNNNDKSVVQTSDISHDSKQTNNEVNNMPMNTALCDSQSMPQSMRGVPSQQTNEPNNANNWSADEFIIEYTSEPKALVPSKRTASLSNFVTAQHMSNTSTTPINPHIIRNNTTHHNIQYLSLNRNGEIPKQWNSYTIDSHNNSQQIRYQLPPNQRSLSPNPSVMSTSPQPVFYQQRPQYVVNPRYPSSQPMPIHVMYNRVSGPLPPQMRPNVQLPVMSQTMGPSQHKQPPPYHYHFQHHNNNEFPNPSEIRRRDGLNAYPHVLNQTPRVGALPVPPIHHNPPNASQTLSKDELEQFVQQDIQRTERIKKRYSMTEEDDPSFGFARRPSVRGIRPKFGTTNDILKQIQTQTAGSNSAIGGQSGGSHISWPNMTNSGHNMSSNQMLSQQHSTQSLQRKPQIVHIRLQAQNPMAVKYATDASDGAQQHSHQTHGPPGGPQMSRTLPRPSSLISESQMNAIRTEEGLVIRLPANTSRDELKQQIQRQLEQQLQTKMRHKMTAMPTTATKPVMSSNDERGAPEGASSSPKHSSDVLFAKNMSSSVKTGETNRQQTNDTKKLVINEENNTNSNDPKDKEGVIYYSMNV